MNGSYDPWLVTLSMAVAVLASYVALDLASRVTVSAGRSALYWLVGGAVSMGLGIWSMHFIAMLAFRLPIPMSYSVSITALSLLIAMVVSGFALYTVSRDTLGRRRLLVGGALMGTGIAAMHYTGMAAMQMSPSIRYDPTMFGLSIVVAIAVAVVALWIAFRLREETILSAFWRKTGSAVLMGAAICGMHYTGMAAAIFAPHSMPMTDAPSLQSVWMGAAIGTFTAMLLTTTLLVSVSDVRRARELGAHQRGTQRLRQSHDELELRVQDRTAELARINTALEAEIDERKRTEMAFRQQQDEAREILDTAYDAFIAMDASSRILKWNLKAEQTFGWQCAEVLGKNLADLIVPPQHRAAHARGVARFMATGEGPVLNKRIEITALHRDGHEFPVELTIWPGRLGADYKFNAFLHDITERKRAEAELEISRRGLAENQQRLAEAQKIAHIGSWEWDVAANTITWSEELYRIYGVNPESFDSSYGAYLERAHPDDREVIDAAVRRAMETREPFAFEHRIIRPDGTIRTMQSIGRVIANDSGEIVRMLGTGQDITERKRDDALLVGQKRVLEGIALGRPLPETLTTLLQILEALSPTMIGSILLLDADGAHLRHVASAGLPEAFQQAVDGLPIDPSVGSCASALFRRVPVMVEDIANDPLWADYSDMALRHGLRACWSAPILDAANGLLGTFAFYWRQPGPPPAQDLRLIEFGTQTVAIAISHHQAGLALRQSEERFATAFSISPDGIVISRLSDGLVVEVNQSWCVLTGWTREETEGRLIKDLGVWVDYSDRERYADCLRKDGRVRGLELVMRRKTGELRNISLSSELMEVHGQMLILALAHDITERKHAESELEKNRRGLVENQNRLEEAQQVAHVGSWEWDIAANTITWSEELYRIYGANPESFDPSYEAFLQRAHPDDREGIDAAVRSAMHTREPFAFEHRIIRPDGTIRMMHAKGRVIANDSREIVRMLGIGQDITERKQAEVQLQHAMVDLTNRNRELQDFAFIASHDLQEPLRKIRAFSDRILSRHAEAFDAEARDYLQRSSQAAARMQALIDDLLAYSRVSSSGKRFAPVALDALMATVIEDLSTRLESSGGRVEVGELPTLDGDPTQLRQLFQNVLANALKFRHPERPPVVRVTAEPAPGEQGGRAWTIRVTDNGIGFEPKHAERVFAPFQRLHNRQDYEGTGIGLAIVRRIVERHRGHIQASGALGHGAVFEIVLPQHQRAPEVDHTSSLSGIVS